MIITTMLLSVVVMHSCTHQSQVPLQPVSFNRDIMPILQTSCALNGSCHLGANNGNAHINFDSTAAYATIFEKQLVSTGNPTASLLYVEISTGIMPKAPYSTLSPAQISTILNWIKQGAINN